MKRTPIAILLTLALCLSLALPALAAEAGEPNDTAQQATPLALNTTLSADLTPHKAGDGDTDWYRLTLDEPGGLTISLRYDKDLSFSATFYRPGADGQLEALRTRYCSAAPADLYATWAPATFYLGAGTYYLKLQAGGYTEGAYTLTTAFAGRDAGTLEQEPNGGSTTATPVELNTTVAGSFYPRNNQNGDIDWYRLEELTSPGRLTLTLCQEGDFYFSVTLYRLDRETGELSILWNQFCPAPTNLAQDTFTRDLGSTYLSPGIYYLDLSATSGQEGNYTFDANFTPLPDGTLEQEPNGTSATATDISLNRSVAGSFVARSRQNGDTDWYRFTTTNDNGLRLSFRLPATVNFSAAVYQPDASGELKTVWSDYYSHPGAEDTATSTYTTRVLDLDRGTYYLRLYANPGNEGDYTLQLLPVQGEQPSAWAREDVYAAIDQGLVPAGLQGNYTGGIARKDMAAVVVCLLEEVSGQSIGDFLAGQGLATDPNTYTDTRDPDVLAASALGILGGVGGGRFAPDSILTRSQIGAILNRTAQVLGENTRGYSHRFTDTAGHWCDSELGWPYAKGIVDGVGGGRFNPDGPLTTEQAIVIAWRAWQVLS